MDITQMDPEASGNMKKLLSHLAQIHSSIQKDPQMRRQLSRTSSSSDHSSRTCTSPLFLLLLWGTLNGALESCPCCANSSCQADVEQYFVLIPVEMTKHYFGGNFQVLYLYSCN
jgi:hypothetical protein